MKKRWAILAIAIIILSSMLVLAYLGYINIKWLIGANHAPTIILISPNHGETVTDNFVNFTWQSSDADGDTLYHYFMIDIVSSMNSPLLEGYDTGQQTYYNYTGIGDGIYWWKVEVSDLKDYTVSETRKVIVKTNASNNFPELINPSVFPSEGTSETEFRYYVTYRDADNDTPDYVKIIINGNTYNMVKDVESDNYIDGVRYTFSISGLPAGNNSFIIYAGDGQAMVSTDVIYAPKVYGEEEIFNHPPEIELISPKNGKAINSKYVTFLFNVTDIDNNLLKTELYLYKDSPHASGSIYSINSGDTLTLSSGTYYWKIVAYDTYSINESDLWYFTVNIFEKQNKITILPDNTVAHPGEHFTGTIVITNEGEADTYEVYWYAYLKDINGNIISQDRGSLALSTTVEVRYSLDVPLGTSPGNYTIDVYTFDNITANSTMLGHASIDVIVQSGGVMIAYQTLLPFSIIILMLVASVIFRIFPLFLATFGTSLSLPVLWGASPVLVILSAIVLFDLYCIYYKRYEEYRPLMIITLLASVILYFYILFTTFI